MRVRERPVEPLNDPVVPVRDGVDSLADGGRASLEKLRLPQEGGEAVAVAKDGLEGGKVRKRQARVELAGEDGEGGEGSLHVLQHEGGNEEGRRGGGSGSSGSGSGAGDSRRGGGAGGLVADPREGRKQASDFRPIRRRRSSRTSRGRGAEGGCRVDGLLKPGHPALVEGSFTMKQEGLEGLYGR